MFGVGDKTLYFCIRLAREAESISLEMMKPGCKREAVTNDPTNGHLKLKTRAEK